MTVPVWFRVCEGGLVEMKTAFFSVDRCTEVDPRYLDWHESVGRLLKTRPIAERYERYVAWYKRHHDD